MWAAHPRAPCNTSPPPPRHPPPHALPPPPRTLPAQPAPRPAPGALPPRARAPRAASPPASTPRARPPRPNLNLRRARTNEATFIMTSFLDLYKPSKCINPYYVGVPRVQSSPSSSSGRVLPRQEAPRQPPRGGRWAPTLPPARPPGSSPCPRALRCSGWLAVRPGGGAAGERDGGGRRLREQPCYPVPAGAAKNAIDFILR